MPYITQEQRKKMEVKTEIIAWSPQNAGELNYAITKLCHDFLGNNVVNYAGINQVIGVLECVKLELYRMVAAPYEDKKLAENGPISNLDKNRND